MQSLNFGLGRTKPGYACKKQRSNELFKFIKNNFNYFLNVGHTIYFMYPSCHQEITFSWETLYCFYLKWHRLLPQFKGLNSVCKTSSVLHHLNVIYRGLDWCVRLIRNFMYYTKKKNHLYFEEKTKVNQQYAMYTYHKYNNNFADWSSGMLKMNIQSLFQHYN